MDGVVGLPDSRVVAAGDSSSEAARLICAWFICVSD